MVGAQGAPPLQPLLGGTPTNFKRSGRKWLAAPGLVWLAPGLRGGWRDGCALQHTTRGKVKCAAWLGARRGPPWGAAAAGFFGAAHFALPLLYAERARLWPGGMMGGPKPRAAVRARSRRDSRAVGEREGVGVRARLPAGSVTREGAARLSGAARSRGAMPARRAAW